MTMKPRRKSETPRLMFEIITRQMAAGHVVHVGTLPNGKPSYRLACPGCGFAIDILDKREREHVIPLALGGADDPTNQQYWHKRCSKVKTFGQSHDCSNGDIHKIAKTKRTGAKHRGEIKPKGNIQNRGFQTNRGGPFKQRVDRTVERRT